MHFLSKKERPVVNIKLEVSVNPSMTVCVYMCISLYDQVIRPLTLVTNKLYSVLVSGLGE